jgi:hypothetical protein
MRWTMFLMANDIFKESPIVRTYVFSLIFGSFDIEKIFDNIIF